MFALSSKSKSVPASNWKCSLAAMMAPVVRSPVGLVHKPPLDAA